jgi:hypothetical protein
LLSGRAYGREKGERDGEKGEREWSQNKVMLWELQTDIKGIEAIVILEHLVISAMHCGVFRFEPFAKSWKSSIKGCVTHLEMKINQKHKGECFCL